MCEIWTFFFFVHGSCFNLFRWFFGTNLVWIDEEKPSTIHYFSRLSLDEMEMKAKHLRWNSPLFNVFHQFIFLLMYYNQSSIFLSSSLAYGVKLLLWQSNSIQIHRWKKDSSKTPIANVNWAESNSYSYRANNWKFGKKCEAFNRSHSKRLIHLLFGQIQRRR